MQSASLLRDNESLEFPSESLLNIDNPLVCLIKNFGILFMRITQTPIASSNQIITNISILIKYVYILILDLLYTYSSKIIFMIRIPINLLCHKDFEVHAMRDERT